MIVYIFERPIRAEVVTYCLDVAFGFLHTQQLRGFDELRNDQVFLIRSAKISKIVASLYLPASYFSYRFLRLAQKNRANGNGKNDVFGRSDEGQDSLDKAFPGRKS
jgi:hypothetical protein